MVSKMYGIFERSFGRSVGRSECIFCFCFFFGFFLRLFLFCERFVSSKCYRITYTIRFEMASLMLDSFHIWKYLKFLKSHSYQRHTTQNRKLSRIKTNNYLLPQIHSMRSDLCVTFELVFFSVLFFYAFYAVLLR